MPSGWSSRGRGHGTSGGTAFSTWCTDGRENKATQEVGACVDPLTQIFPGLKGDEPRPLFAFPGIWRRWKGPIKKDGHKVDIEVYSFMTTLPNALTQTINHERSPVILTEEAQFEMWLSGTRQEAFSLVKSFDADRMHIVQEGFGKEDRVAA
jgi:hypothetical protein